ncbi:MAG: flagellar hook-associated protein 2, partial [Verrucomicrobiota bacterium]
ATGGAVTGNYDSTTDKITFASASPIVLGSASDTSNFLAAARLYNNGTGTISSGFALGVIRPGSSLATANLATAVTDGGAGAGQFKVNGVSLSFNASTDTLSSVLARINNSAAGVSASYDGVNDRIVLTNRTTGDLGVALEDVTGNFLAATGLTGGTLSRGNNLLYSVDGGAELTGQSNTISAADSGIAGLDVTALGEGTTTVTVSSDTSKIRTAITDFIAQYNKTQTLINTQTASTTDAQGKVTAGILAGESDAGQISSKLRSLVNSVASGLTGTLTQLAALGIDSNGNDDTITLKDGAKLDAALAGNLSGVQDLFSNATSGLAVKLSTYLEATAGDSGSLVSKQGNLTRQSAAIDTQAADLERLVLRRRQQMIDSFVAMESAQARISQQLQFLQQRFGN